MLVVHIARFMSESSGKAPSSFSADIANGKQQQQQRKALGKTRRKVVGVEG
jgi:hypothetical protein